MHHTPLLGARASVFQDQPLGLVLTSAEPGIPDFLVVVEIQFQGRQVAENVFGILGDGIAGAFQSPGVGSVVRLRCGRNRSGLRRRKRGGSRSTERRR